MQSKLTVRVDHALIQVAKVWEKVETAAHSITTLFYRLSKHKTRLDASNNLK